jgi:hypothetical protein
MPGWHPIPMHKPYLLFDVDDLEVAAALIQATREEADGVRADQYFRFELRIGRPFYAREE